MKEIILIKPFMAALISITVIKIQGLTRRSQDLVKVDCVIHKNLLYIQILYILSFDNIIW